jgi:hypothetical protein
MAATLPNSMIVTQHAVEVETGGVNCRYFWPDCTPEDINDTLYKALTTTDNQEPVLLAQNMNCCFNSVNLEKNLVTSFSEQ